VQVLPGMMGFLAYKAAALVQVYRDNEDLRLILPDEEAADSDSTWFIRIRDYVNLVVVDKYKTDLFTTESSFTFELFFVFRRSWNSFAYLLGRGETGRVEWKIIIC
jgi:hypothetical protein